MIQHEFSMLVYEAVERSKDALGNRFVAAYLHGSIEKGDAVAGVSDLDMMLISSEEDSAHDIPWITGMIVDLKEKYPVIDEAHIALMPLKQLKDDRFTRFALAYNAALMAGSDIVAELNKQDPESYMPDRLMAKRRLNFARACLNDALKGKTPQCTGDLPQNTFFAARKLARYFVVIEGAYFLMARNRFESFSKELVIKGLRTEAGQFAEVIDLAESVLNDPVAAGVRRDELIQLICAFTNWMFDQIEAS